MDTSQLANKVKELRTLKGMSQESLADTAQLGLRTIQRIENNQSKPVGETLKRLSIALGADMEELIGYHHSPVASHDIDSTILLLQRRLSNAQRKSDIKTLESFINVLENLNDKDLTAMQIEAIESYMNYLALDEVPPYNHDLVQKKFKEFRAFLRSHLQFVPNHHYTYWTFVFALPFSLTFSMMGGVDFGVKVAALMIAAIAVGLAALIDLQIKKQNRALRF